MYEYSVCADIFSIKIISQSVDITDYLFNRLKDFSRLSITFKIIDYCNEYDATLMYCDSIEYKFSFDAENKVFVLAVPWKEISNSTLLPMSFRLIVEWLRQNQQEIKMHASAVEHNGKASLFIAPSEGGKTTTALSLCQKYNCILRANDASVVKFLDNTPFLLRGDTEFKVRSNGLAAYSQKLYNDKIKNDGELPWYDRTYLSADELGIKINNVTSPITNLFFVKLDNMISDLKVIEYSCEIGSRQKYWFKPKLLIMQNISGTICSSDLLPMGNDGSILPLRIPDIDNDDLFRYRILFVNSLFEKCRVFQLRGQLDPMVEYIRQRMMIE